VAAGTRQQSQPDHAAALPSAAELEAAS
jgi:hypothetical protein